jgi:hypothetical protein
VRKRRYPCYHAVSSNQREEMVVVIYEHVVVNGLISCLFNVKHDQQALAQVIRPGPA